MKKLFAYFGVDRAIAYALIGRGWSLISGVVTLFLVARSLTPSEQGYYYTFASLVAMQILFELGMSIVIMQFASHEMARLSWQSDGTVGGDDNAKARLRSLLLLVTKWYGVIAILIVAVILPTGWIFFMINNPQVQAHWQLAWVWLVLTAAINIFFLPLLSLLEGCGCITEIAKLRMVQNIFGSLTAWIFLTCGAGLLAMPAMGTALALTAGIWLWKSKNRFVHDLLRFPCGKTAGIDWKLEIWPFQWRIALSWMSGFFIFQLFTPVLFAYRGAIEAGQMGMSFSIANALMSIGMAWMGTKAPKFGALIALGDYSGLNQLFRTTLLRSIGVMLALGLSLCAVNYILHVRNVSFAVRFLDPVPFGFLITATILNYVTYAQSTYLRAHKQEPFLIISLISGALIAILTISIVGAYGAMGISAAYLAVCSTVGFGWGSIIFLSKKREWGEHSLLNGSAGSAK